LWDVWRMSCYPCSHPFYAILLWANQSKLLSVLIDSGADESFLYATLASELNIPAQPLSIPVDIRALDRRSIGRVTHSTTPIHLHQDPLIPMQLGCSWLQRHNPLIHWSTGAIMGSATPIA
jgi:hypothetical protein